MAFSAVLAPNHAVSDYFAQRAYLLTFTQMKDLPHNDDALAVDALVDRQTDRLRDGRQSETAMRIMRGVSRMMSAQNFASMPEITLPNHRRADLFAIGSRGEIWIIEIKSSLTDFLTDQKWPEYQEYCDCFFFAVDPDFPLDRLPDDVGLILADAYGAEIIRPAPIEKLAGARRNVLTRHAARVGAARLTRLSDPRRPSGIQQRS